MKYNLHDVLKKIVVYYKRKHKNVKNEFLVMIVIIFMNKTMNLQGIRKLSKFYIYSKMIKYIYIMY